MNFMKKTSSLILLLVFATALCAQVHFPRVFIRNVTIVDVQTGVLLPEIDVAISDGRIRETGKNLKRRKSGQVMISRNDRSGEDRGSDHPRRQPARRYRQY